MAAILKGNRHGDIGARTGMKSSAAPLREASHSFAPLRTAIAMTLVGEKGLPTAR
jgi:hypothetical protein